VPIINTLAEVDIDRLADMVTSVSFADGDVIMAQDDIGDAMYILHTGETGAYLKQNPRGNAVRRYKSTEFFGEIAMIRSDSRRQASIKAIGAATCLKLGRTPFSILLKDGQVGTLIMEHVREKYDIVTEEEEAAMGVQEDEESSSESEFGESDDEDGGNAGQMALLSMHLAEQTSMDEANTFLHRVPLLQSVSETDLEKVSDMMTSVEYADGDVIMQQGDEGDAMYILEEGSVAAEIEGVGVVKTYETTEYFGEVALVREGNTRAATVKSVGASKCLRLGKKPFAIVLSAGSCGEIMRDHVARLLGETGDESDESGFGDSDDEEEGTPRLPCRFGLLVRDSRLFRRPILGFADAPSPGVVAVTNLRMRHVHPAFNSIQPDGALCGAGGGDAAEQMAALAMMTADSSALEANREFLATVPIINTLAEVDIDRLADMVTSVSFADGDVIMAQDDIGDAMYILQSGAAGAYLKQNPRKSVHQYSSAEFFGEIAMIRSDARRQATVKAVGEVKCLKLVRTPFSILLKDSQVGSLIKEHVKEKYGIDAEEV